MIALLATIVAMLAAGPATTQSAPRAPRAARSVHLRYAADECDLFYNEMTVTRSTPGSYFMACGFTGGYFGIQELVDGKKIAIFSVWDPTSGDEQADVPVDERVKVIFRHQDVTVKRFGGEGTGVQSLFPFRWSERQTICFLVRAQVDGERTIYAAYMRPKAMRNWTHLASLATLNKGKRLSGLYSFIEDFRRDTKSANEMRMARFSNGWVRSKEDWIRLTEARFTASGAEWEAKDTIDAGIDAKAFFLQTGGETKQQTTLGDTIVRTAPSEEAPPAIPGK